MDKKQPEALRRSTAADGKTELFNLPGYPLMVRAVDFNRIHTESEMRRTALLDEMQKAALAAGQATAAQLGAYAALSESFLEIPDVQDESGINAYYSREVVLECIDAALASHGQAPASVLHLVNSAFAEIAMAFPKAFALHKVGIADKAVREALAAPATAQADSVLEDAAREAIEKVLALFPFNVPIQKFTVNNGPCLTADNDDEFYSVKRVLAFLTEIKTTLDAARKQGATQ